MMLLKEDEIASKQGAEPLDSIDMDLNESVDRERTKTFVVPQMKWLSVQ